MQNGIPFVISCPEAKVVSFNRAKTSEGVGCMVFTIKNSQNNTLWTCVVFDDEESHILYKRALSIQKGAYYFITGEVNQRQKKDGVIEPIIKVTSFFLCYEEESNNNKAIKSLSGYGN